MFLWSRRLDRILAGMAILASKIDILIAQGKTLMALSNDLLAADANEAAAINAAIAEMTDVASTLQAEAKQIADLLAGSTAANDPDIAALATRMAGRAQTLVDATKSLQQTQVSIQTPASGSSGNDSVNSASGNDTISGADGNDSLSSRSSKK